MGRENRRETIKSNSWKLSLHVRPTFFYALLLYIYIGFVQFFALNKREKFVPRANGTSTPWKWKFSQRRGKPICSECNILQLYIYIYILSFTRAFSKILDSTSWPTSFKCIYIRRRYVYRGHLFEFHFKIGLIPRRIREISSRRGIRGLA